MRIETVQVKSNIFGAAAGLGYFPRTSLPGRWLLRFGHLPVVGPLWARRRIGAGLSNKSGRRAGLLKSCANTIAPAQAGKTILCDKPLARNLEEAHQMVDAAKKAGVRTMVWYNYRGIPAVTLAKEIIASGKLGRRYSGWNRAELCQSTWLRSTRLTS
jgi:hypothetical protein